MTLTRRGVSPRTVAAIAWLGGLLCLSLLPLDMKHYLHTTGSLHRWGHLIIFILTGALLCARRPLSGKLLFLIAAVFFGFTLEWLESRFFHNNIEWRDVRTDTIGASIGAGLTLLEGRKRSQDHRLA